jgi:hypothetical protein
MTRPMAQPSTAASYRHVVVPVTDPGLDRIISSQPPIRPIPAASIYT